MLLDKYSPQRRVIMKKFSLLMTLCSLASMVLSGCSCAGNGNGDSSSCNCSTSEPTTSVPSTSESTSTTPIIEKYIVSFKNYDETLLSESIVEKGGTAVYEGQIPSRPEDEQYTYTFKGWDKPLTNITSDCVRVAQFNATKKPVTNYYTVTFKNYDDTVLTTDNVVEGGTAVYKGNTPTRPETAEYSYSFSGWDKPLTNITSDCVRVAQFTETAKPVTKYYTVTFKNYDDTVLTTDNVVEGGTAVYKGSTPIRPETAEYSYTFSGWDKPLTNITSDCVRVAQYSETAKPVTKYYTVTFKNYDDSILHEALVKEGGDATYGGPTPTRTSTSEFSYAFTGWDKPLTNITSDCIRVAQYQESYIEYTVKFYNWDNTLLYTDTVHYGQSASYYGVTPTKPATETHYYVFAGWDKDISNITKSINVYATFDTHGDGKHIVLNPGNGDETREIEVTFDENYDLGTPVFPGFTFLGWYSGSTLIPTSGVWSYSNVTSLTAKWQNNYFIFTENGDNTYTVSLNDEGKAASEIVIPSVFEGIKINALGTDFLRANTKIEKVTIPGSIKNIPEYSFYNCTNLKQLVLSEGLISIGQYAFAYCALTKLIVPSTCTTIERQAFDYNRSLYHVYIPSSVATMGPYAFDDLNSYTYICIEHTSVPSGWNSNWTNSTYYTSSTKLVEADEYNYVIRSNYGDLSVTILRLAEATSKLQDFAFPTEIEGISNIRVGRYLFYNNLYIRNVDFTGVARIGYSAFTSCTNLVSITFSNSLTYIDSNAFRYCSSLLRVEIPESVTEIQSMAFDACTGLEYIYIPSSVVTIAGYAFDACNKSTIYTNAHSNNSGWSSNWKGSQPIFYDFVSIGEEDDFNYVIQSYMGDSYVSISSMKASAKQKKNIVIPNEIAGISDIRLKDSLFNGFNELVSVDFGSGVKNIPSNCLANCSKLENVILHEGLTTISSKAFYNCSKLKTINMPSTLTSIASQAFDYCSSLGKIVIPLSVSSIGSYAFDDTGRLVFLIEASVSQPNWASNWYGTTTSSKTFIYDYVSMGEISDFKYVKSSNGVDDKIFIIGLKDNTSNVNLVVPDVIEGISDIKIASYAFDGNTIIKSIDLGNSVTSVNAYAFRGNTSLRSVIVPLSCSVIKNYAFQNCSTECVIKCEAESLPSTWESSWNSSNCQVVWGYIR